jgi:hypothetical protein
MVVLGRRLRLMIVRQNEAWRNDERECAIPVVSEILSEKNLLACTHIHDVK